MGARCAALEHPPSCAEAQSPHRPDALSRCTSQMHRMASNMPTSYLRRTGNFQPGRMREKLEAHVQFFMQGKQIEAYGFRKVRAVLVETLSEEHARQLRELARDLATELPLAGMLFWFSFIPSVGGTPFIHIRRWSCAQMIDCGVLWIRRTDRTAPDSSRHADMNEAAAAADACACSQTNI